MRISDWSSDVCSSDLASNSAAGARGDDRLTIRCCGNGGLGNNFRSKSTSAHSFYGDIGSADRIGCHRQAVGVSFGVFFRLFATLGVGSRVCGAAGDRKAADCCEQHGASHTAEEAFVLCDRSEEHTSELPSLMRISYAVFCLKKETTRRRQRQM